MPQFRLRARARPEEVSLSISGSGVTASVVPPESARSDFGVHEVRLSTALHVAGALADRLGTDVAVVDSSADIFFIEDADDDIVFM